MCAYKIIPSLVCLVGLCASVLSAQQDGGAKKAAELREQSEKHFKAKRHVDAAELLGQAEAIYRKLGAVQRYGQ